MSSAKEEQREAVAHQLRRLCLEWHWAISFPNAVVGDGMPAFVLVGDPGLVEILSALISESLGVDMCHGMPRSNDMLN